METDKDARQWIQRDRPCDVARLLESCIDQLARTWSVILQYGVIPDTWTNVRLVGIDKNDGTTDKRGLGISHYGWIAQHKLWIQSWLHIGIRSGPGRQMDDIIKDLIDDLFHAEE